MAKTSKNTLFAANNSIRASISNLALIGSTHFIPVNQEDPAIRAEFKTLPDAIRMLTEMVSATWGTAVYLVLPEYSKFSHCNILNG